MIPVALAGDDPIAAFGASGCHRQLWPKSRPIDNHCDRQLDDLLTATEDAIAIKPERVDWRRSMVAETGGHQLHRYLQLTVLRVWS